MGFNLVDDSFIDVLTKRGPETHSLIDLFNHLEDIIDLDLKPNAKVAVMRFLMAIVDATGLLEDSESIEMYCGDRSGFISGCIEYLEKHRDCFNLYGDRPFLQAPFLADSFTKKNIKTESLNMPIEFLHRIGKSTKALLDSDYVYDSIRPADKEIALGLIIQQCYSANYKASAGDVISDASGIPFVQTSGATPDFIKKQSLMTFFVRGKNLLETLLYNTYTKEEIPEIFPQNSKDVRPVWELDNTSYKSMENSVDKFSYSNRLVSYTRLIKIPEQGSMMIYVGGPKYEDLPENNTYYKRFAEKSTNKTWRKTYEKEGHMWRSLDVISPVSLNKPAGVLGYRILDILKAMDSDYIDIEAFGAAVSNSSGLLYVSQWYNSSFRVKNPQEFFMSIGIRCKFRKAMNYSSAIENKLQKASEDYFNVLNITDSNVKREKLEILTNKYWDTLNNFKHYLEDSNTHNEWYKKVRYSAYSAFKCYDGVSFDVKKAYAIGFNVLKSKGLRNGSK